MDLFRIDSPLMQKLSLLFDLMTLNLLTILLSIPIFTIGAASTALYDAVWRLKHDRGSLLKDYWRCFRENLKQSTVLLLFVLLFGFVLGYSVLLLIGGQEGMDLMWIPIVLGGFVWIILLTWIFPLQSRFRNSPPNTIVNAVLCGLRFLPQTVAMAALNSLPCVLLILKTDVFFRMGLIWAFLWFGLTAYWNICLLNKPLHILSGIKEGPSDAELSCS